MAILPIPYSLKGLELKNRIVMAPMCQYSVHTEDGMPNDWHYVHYVSRAVGGTGLIHNGNDRCGSRRTNYE